MFDDWKNILVISTHTDDAELMMGGTINKLINSGYNVHHLILSSSNQQAIARGYDPNQLIEESWKANAELGINKDNYHLVNPGYDTDYFHIYRQEVANTLFKAKEYYKPDVVFVNSRFDTHQDHQVTYNEATRIFKEIGIIGYEFPYNNFSFRYNMVVGLTKENMYHKVEAVKCFESQHDRVYSNENYIRSLAKAHSVRIKSTHPYAEAFEVVRIVW